MDCSLDLIFIQLLLHRGTIETSESFSGTFNLPSAHQERNPSLRIQSLPATTTQSFIGPTREPAPSTMFLRNTTVHNCTMPYHGAIFARQSAPEQVQGGGMSKWAIGGIVLGLIVAIGMLGWLIAVLYKCVTGDKAANESRADHARRHAQAMNSGPEEHQASKQIRSSGTPTPPYSLPPRPEPARTRGVQFASPAQHIPSTDADHQGFEEIELGAPARAPTCQCHHNAPRPPPSAKGRVRVRQPPRALVGAAAASGIPLVF